MTLAQHHSKSEEHFTPAPIVQAARRLMGNIELDPASCQEANEVVQASRIFTKADSGLDQIWKADSVFLNPPGGCLRKNEASQWVSTRTGESAAAVWWSYLSHQHELGQIKQAFFVGFTLEVLRSAQKACEYYHRAVPVQNYFRCYPRNRIAFSGESPTHANVLVWLPPKGGFPLEQSLHFSACFSQFGFCEGPAL